MIIRLDKREIPGASDRPDDAPDLFKVRISKRGRVPKREWPKVEASKSRKKQQIITLLTPLITQTSTQASTDSFIIYNNIVKTEAIKSALIIGEIIKLK